MKYIIHFNYGYGDEYEEIDVETLTQAEQWAYESWKEGAECQAEYEVVGESTEELREAYL